MGIASGIKRIFISLCNISSLLSAALRQGKLLGHFQSVALAVANNEILGAQIDKNHRDLAAIVRVKRAPGELSTVTPFFAASPDPRPRRSFRTEAAAPARPRALFLP